MVYALVAGRWVLALGLLGAGLAKVGDREQLSEVIERYAIIPTGYGARLAIGLPWLEIVVGVALAIGLGLAVSGLCATLLLLGFAGAVGINLARGRRFDCGCGGSLSGEIGWSLLVRNLILAAIGVAVALGPTGLAVSTRTLVGAPAHVGASDLLPIPLIVIAISGLARCLQSFAAGRITRTARSGETGAA
ncbi:MAG: MauE/DoxX family redox-associated membrane protein [Pseudonocardiaceae bacterium]